MARPIDATPTLKGKDAERFLKDFFEINKKMGDPTYRKKVERRLRKCAQLYEKFCPSTSKNYTKTIRKYCEYYLAQTKKINKNSQTNHDYQEGRIITFAEIINLIEDLEEGKAVWGLNSIIGKKK